MSFSNKGLQFPNSFEKITIKMTLTC